VQNSGRHFRIAVDNPDWARSVQQSAIHPSHQSAIKGHTGIRGGSGTSYSNRIGSIVSLPILLIAGSIPLLLAATPAPVKKGANAPLPPISELVREVRDRQYKSDKVRENYSYTSLQTTQDIDANGQVKKTETIENQEFFVNTHVIERTIRKNGRPLDDHEQQKEAERVSKLVEKAEKTPPDQPLQGLSTDISRIPGIIGRMLQIMEVGKPRRVSWHNRPTIVFDFVGRKDAKTHSLAEDTSKELQGSIWIDEDDRQIAHLEVSFNDDFRVASGLVASIEKGSSFHFDQAPVNGEVWLPTGGEGAVQARILMVKTLRQRYYERDYDYKRLRVDIPQQIGTRVALENRP
jgi:hypothetical protein